MLGQSCQEPWENSGSLGARLLWHPGGSVNPTRALRRGEGHRQPVRVYTSQAGRRGREGLEPGRPGLKYTLVQGRSTGTAPGRFRHQQKAWQQSFQCPERGAAASEWSDPLPPAFPLSASLSPPRNPGRQWWRLSSVSSHVQRLKKYLLSDNEGDRVSDPFPV